MRIKTLYFALYCLTESKFEAPVLVRSTLTTKISRSAQCFVTAWFFTTRTGHSIKLSYFSVLRYSCCVRKYYLLSHGNHILYIWVFLLVVIQDKIGQSVYVVRCFHNSLCLFVLSRVWYPRKNICINYINLISIWHPL